MRRIMAKKVGGASGYDPDFQAWIDAVNSKGYYLAPNEKLQVVNNFIEGCKTDGIYKFDYLYLRCWNDLGMENGSLIDIVRPNIEGVINGTLIYKKGCLKGNNSGWFDPKFNPAVDGINYKQNSAGKMALIAESQTSGLGEIFGNPSSGTAQTMYNTSQAAQRINSITSVSSAVNLSGIGLKAMYRDSDVDIRAYNKGLEKVTEQPQNFFNGDIIEFKRSTIQPSDIGIAISAHLGSLTQIEHQLLRSRINTLLIGMGLTPYA